MLRTQTGHSPDEVRRQARATGSVKLGACVIAEVTHREPLPPHELLKRLRLREIETVVRHRHGHMVQDARGTDDYETVTHYLLAVAGSLGDPVGFAQRWMPWFDDDDVLKRANNLAATMMALKRGPAVLRADAVAKLICVTFEERQKLGLKTIGCCDVDRRERNRRVYEARKATERFRISTKRRAAGIQPRSEYIAQSLSAERPWIAAGMSRASWYRKRRETGVLQVEVLRTSENTTCNTLVSNRLANSTAIIPGAFGQAPTIEGECLTRMNPNSPEPKAKVGLGTRPQRGVTRGCEAPVTRNWDVLRYRRSGR